LYRNPHNISLNVFMQLVTLAHLSARRRQAALRNSLLQRNPDLLLQKSSQNRPPSFLFQMS
jgi:hypothetical protein